VAPGLRGDDSRVLRVHSTRPFSAAMADLLLDVQTASSQQRYQVSLVTGMASQPVAPETAQADSSPRAAASDAEPATSAGSLDVQRGDTMFALARRHTVEGVSVYQWMLAVQRANPQAFIHDNINLVRAGVRLSLPDRAAMLSISDREA